ncbi:MAG: hypothetical protein Q7J25_11335 [Vicinamibacterales bacterium]|nr:hypothetical protein [Vicinamibacterales bacterium]
MPGGLLAYPRRRLNPELRAAAREAMRAGQPSGSAIALLSGFRNPQAFSSTLHARRVPATPLTIERLQRVAELVGFKGELFLMDPDDMDRVVGSFREVPVAPVEPVA